MAAPNSTKLRRTKVKIDWFWDQHRNEWRFLPVDLAHRAEHMRQDASGESLQPQRPYEAKGWVPATIALQNIKESTKVVPEPVKQMYGSLLDGDKSA